MEKLIVKNFGPIKEAEIDLTKYVVFIGDTSTGKSLLAKLIAIFRDNDLLFSTDRNKDFNNLLSYYNIDFDTKNGYLTYYTDRYHLEIENENVKMYEEGKILEFSEGQTDKIRKKDLLDFSEKLHELVKDDNLDLKQISTIKNLLDKFIEMHNEFPSTIPLYIPAERILNSLIGSSVSGLWANNVALPSYFKDFAGKFEVARKFIKNKNYKDFGVSYKFRKNLDFVTFAGKQIRLSQASSGIQSLVPLLLLFDYELSNKKLRKTILIEEPELNLFPIKQKGVIEYVISGLNNTVDKLLITTHSPYVLSALDTLILAKNTFIEHPDLKKEINTIISEDKWIDYDDISVYEVKNNGTVRSIKNEEFRSIDTNAIDGVSDVISEEFDKLTELRYAQ